MARPGVAGAPTPSGPVAFSVAARKACGAASWVGTVGQVADAATGACATA